MPLQKCEENGWRWGDQGKCYHGKDGKKKAIKQGIAIEGPEKFSKKVSEAKDFLDKDTQSVVEWMQENGFKLGEITATCLDIKRSIDSRNEKSNDA